MKTILYIIAIIIVNFMVAFVAMSSGDELRIGISCYPKVLQQKFADKGLKLDLSGNDRTEDSWGFIENKGSNYSIFTYRSVQKEDFAIIQDLIMERKDG